MVVFKDSTKELVEHTGLIEVDELLDCLRVCARVNTGMITIKTKIKRLRP
jgi:hypothetical protein